MSKDFEWKTEEEIHWDEPVGGQPANLRLWFKRWWRGLALLAVLLLIVVSIIYSVLNRRVQQAEDTTTAAILAAHTLLHQAVQDKDFDLLNALLSQKDPHWSQLQTELLHTELFLDRRPLDLKIEPEGTVGSQPITVTLSPDLQTAELIERIPYSVGDQQNAKTIWLEHTFHYQRQEESWLLMSLPDKGDFWGSWQTSKGNYINLVYPQREEQLAPFLLERFDALVGRICQDEIINCPPNFTLELRLDPDPDSLQRLNENSFNIFMNSFYFSRYQFSLPSPTVVGRPIDEAGNEALYQGYANWLGSVIIKEFLDQAIVLNQPMAEKLAAWGLEPPPKPLPVLPLPQRIPPPPIPFPEQDILLACADLTNSSLLRYDPRANQWFDELSGNETSAPPLQIWPFSDLIMVPLPDDSGVVFNLATFSPYEFHFQLVSWQSGQERLWFESDQALELLPELLWRQFDPSGRNLVLIPVNFSQDNNGNPGQQTMSYGLNLEACLSGSCEPQLYNGIPYWSPNLSWALLSNWVPQSELVLRNEQTGEEILLGEGHSPFWLDDESFVYLRTVEAPTSNSPLMEIVTAVVDDPLNGAVLIDSADISAALIHSEAPPNSDTLAEDDPNSPIDILSVAAHPDQADWLFIAAARGAATTNSMKAAILSFQVDSGRLSPIITSENSFLGPFLQITANGRLMPVQANGSTSSSNFLYIVPLDPALKMTGLPETYSINGGPFYEDWSQDGRWLLLTGQNAIRLIAPGHNYDQTITHDTPSCTTAVWVNPQ